MGCLSEMGSDKLNTVERVSEDTNRQDTFIYAGRENRRRVSGGSSATQPIQRMARMSVLRIGLKGGRGRENAHATPVLRALDPTLTLAALLVTLRA